MTTVPSNPGLLTASEKNSNSVRLRGVDPANVGSSINAREIYGQRRGTPSPTVHTGYDLDYTWNNLLPGTTCDFWWRVHNGVGWSAFSSKLAVTLYSTPNAPVAPTLSSITQTTFRASWPDPFAGGTGINSRKIGITTSPTALPTTALPYHGSNFDLYGSTGLGGPLEPGGTYYVRAQAGNSIGFGPWGPATELDLVGGAWVKHEGVWRRATPYVRDAGVWKLTLPQGRILGIWEECG